MTERRIAAVTGGSRGIGYGIAQKLTQAGFDLAIMGTSSAESVSEQIDALKQTSKVIYYQGSISEHISREGFITAINSEYGRLDVLVNNAGVAPKVRMDMLDTTEESFDYVIDTNLKGTFFLTQSAANYMIRSAVKNCFIVNIASISSYTSSTGRAEYCISKAGISMLTALFADRLAEYGICVYEVRPGIIHTDMTSGVHDKYDKLIDGGLLPFKRWGYPDDVGNAVKSLVSGDFRYSTGEIINVDGGFHLRRL